jgi:DNA-binding NarL/FixJ family response regulator
MIRVFLADDHAIVLQGLKRLLEADKEFQIVGEALHARDVLRAAANADWDLLVLDLSLPGGGGLEVLSRMRQLNPRVRVVVYSMYPEAQYARRAIDAGARAYVAKERHPDELVEALRVVARGGRFVSGEPETDIDAPAPRAELTERELQVLQLLVEERTPAQIALELAVGRSTVSTHIGQLKRKLGVTSIAGLVRVALRDRDPNSN